MSNKKTTNEDEVIEREINERVDVHMAIEPSTVKELGNGVFEAVITTSTIDRGGESIDTAGIDTTNYMNNPVVLYGHDYEGLPIGKAVKLSQFKNKIKAQFQLAVEEYPFAATVAALIKGGYLNATSIGGIVKQWSEDYKTIKEMEMVEFSVVPVPANQEALMTSRSLKSLTGKSAETVRQEYQDFVAKASQLLQKQDMPAGMPAMMKKARSRMADATSMMDDMMGMMDEGKSLKDILDNPDNFSEDEVKEAIKGLKLALARLEDTASLADEDIKTVKRYVLADAKAVVTESQKVIKIVKLNTKD